MPIPCFQRFSSSKKMTRIVLVIVGKKARKARLIGVKLRNFEMEKSQYAAPFFVHRRHDVDLKNGFTARDL